jgi:hypothetical protein
MYKEDWVEKISKDIYHGRIVLPSSNVSIGHNIKELLDNLEPKSSLELSKEPREHSNETPYEFFEIYTKVKIIKLWVGKAYDEFTPIWLPFFNTYFKGKQFEEVFTDYIKARPFLL